MSAEMHAEERWLHRLEQLSDGIFVIAMTLSALEIHASKDWNRTF
jgi:uncharacterized membrane protein